MSRYLVIPRVQVNNANAQPVYWIVSAPPPTAFHGFSHALGLAIGAQTQGIGIIHHHIEFLGEAVFGTLHPYQFRAAGLIDQDDYSSKNPYALSAQPSARCHLTVSLVIRFTGAAEAQLSLEKVHNFLAQARIAGGSIIEYEEINLSSDPEEICKTIHSGQALHERQDLMVREPGEDYLDVILRQTRNHKDKFLMPTTLGYRTITPIEKRRNSRKRLPHAYVDPLVGLVQYQPLRTGGIPLWIAKHDAANQTFIVTVESIL